MCVSSVTAVERFVVEAKSQSNHKAHRRIIYSLTHFQRGEGKRFLSRADGCLIYCGLLAAQKYVAVCSSAFRLIMESEPFFVLSPPRFPANLKCFLNGSSALSLLNCTYPYPTSVRALSPGKRWYHNITLWSLCPCVQKSFTSSPAFLMTAEGN